MRWSPPSKQPSCSSEPRPRASFKAWASCHHLALIEVWRGLRDDYTWALKSHFVWKKSQRILGDGDLFQKGLGLFLHFWEHFWQPLWEGILLLGWDLFFFKINIFNGKGNGKGSIVRSGVVFGSDKTKSGVFFLL